MKTEKPLNIPEMKQKVKSHRKVVKHLFDKYGISNSDRSVVWKCIRTVGMIEKLLSDNE